MAQKIRVLLTGCTGMLGGAILRALVPCPEIDLLGVARSAGATLLRVGAELRPLDLIDASEVAHLGEHSFDWVLHTAANVSVDACEQDPEGSRLLHRGATAALVSAFPGARFVYVSTDSVFDGWSAPYDEQAQTNPLNHYARTKLEGEQEAARAAHHHILRLSIVGFHTPALRSSLVEWAFQSWNAGRVTTGFEDIFFNPLSCRTVADFLRKAVLGRLILPEGVLHLGSAAPVSKLRFLQLLAQELGHPPSVVEVARFSERSAGFRANRPTDLTLVSTRAAAAGFVAPPVEDEVVKLVADFKSAGMNV